MQELKLEPKEQETLHVGTVVEVTGAWTTADPAVVTALDAFHVWTPDYLIKRCVYCRLTSISSLRFELQPWQILRWSQRWMPSKCGRPDTWTSSAGTAGNSTSHCLLSILYNGIEVKRRVGLRCEPVSCQCSRRHKPPGDGLKPLNPADCAGGRSSRPRCWSCGAGGCPSCSRFRARPRRG